MAEQQGHTPESEFSAEQERLIDSARALLALPSTQIFRTTQPHLSEEPRQPSPSGRHEKIASFLSKLIGKLKQPSEPPKQPSETQLAMRVVRTRPVYWGVQDNLEGNWYLGDEVITVINVGVTSERLVMYREIPDSMSPGSPDGDDMGSRVQEHYELLRPVEESIHITRMQERIDAALIWEHGAANTR